MTEAAAVPSKDDRAATAEGPGWGWFLFMGIVFAIAGSVAVLLPMVSTFAVSLIFGATLAVTGIIRTVQAFGCKKWRGFFLNLLLGLVHLVGGVFIWFNPTAGALVITLTLVLVLAAQGVGEIILAIRVRPESGWGWLLVSGVVALIAAIWIFLRIPVAGVFLPGLILGIALLFEGWAFIVIALNWRRRSSAS